MVAAGAGHGLGHWTPPCGFCPRIRARGGGTIHDSPRRDKARVAMEPLASRTLLVSCRGLLSPHMGTAFSSSRFERSGSTVRVAADGARIALTVCSTRIVRVALEDGTPAAAPSYVGARSWPAA